MKTLIKKVKTHLLTFLLWQCDYTVSDLPLSYNVSVVAASFKQWVGATSDSYWFLENKTEILNDL